MDHKNSYYWLTVRIHFVMQVFEYGTFNVGPSRIFWHHLCRVESNDAVSLFICVN